MSNATAQQIAELEAELSKIWEKEEALMKEKEHYQHEAFRAANLRSADPVTHVDANRAAARFFLAGDLLKAERRKGYEIERRLDILRAA